MSYELSVIVPVYNVESFIRKCIDSILSQTFMNFELILVDDGSPDKSGEICDEYTMRDSRIKVIHKKNGGLSSARNAGIEIAQGEYIGFVDSDDYIEKDMYETMLNISREYDADVVECGFSKVKGKEMEPIIHKEGITMGNNLLALKLLTEYGLHSVVCNKVYKRHLFNGLRFPDGKIHEDEFIMHKIFFYLNRYVYFGKSKYFYVQREGSIMHEGYSLKTLNRLEAYEDRFYFLKKNIKEEYILRLTEYKFFMGIIENYIGLNNNSKLDIHRIYRKYLRQCILKNYSGFLKNDLLMGYRRFIFLAKLNECLLNLLYNIYPKLRDRLLDNRRVWLILKRR